MDNGNGKRAVYFFQSTTVVIPNDTGYDLHDVPNDTQCIFYRLIS